MDKLKRIFSPSKDNNDEATHDPGQQGRVTGQNHETSHISSSGTTSSGPQSVTGAGKAIIKPERPGPLHNVSTASIKSGVLGTGARSRLTEDTSPGPDKPLTSHVGGHTETIIPLEGPGADAGPVAEASAARHQNDPTRYDATGRSFPLSGGTQSSTPEPRASELANKADPRVEPDRNDNRSMGATTGATGYAGPPASTFESSTRPTGLEATRQERLGGDDGQPIPVESEWTERMPWIAEHGHDHVGHGHEFGGDPCEEEPASPEDPHFTPGHHKVDTANRLDPSENAGGLGSGVTQTETTESRLGRDDDGAGIVSPGAAGAIATKNVGPRLSGDTGSTGGAVVSGFSGQALRQESPSNRTTVPARSDPSAANALRSPEHRGITKSSGGFSAQTGLQTRGSSAVQQGPNMSQEYNSAKSASSPQSIQGTRMADATDERGVGRAASTGAGASATTAALRGATPDSAHPEASQFQQPRSGPRTVERDVSRPEQTSSSASRDPQVEETSLPLRTAPSAAYTPSPYSSQPLDPRLDSPSKSAQTGQRSDDGNRARNVGIAAGAGVATMAGAGAYAAGKDRSQDNMPASTKMIPRSAGTGQTHDNQTFLADLEPSSRTNRQQDNLTAPADMAAPSSRDAHPAFSSTGSAFATDKVAPPQSRTVSPTVSSRDTPPGAAAATPAFAADAVPSSQPLSQTAQPAQYIGDPGYNSNRASLGDETRTQEPRLPDAPLDTKRYFEPQGHEPPIPEKSMARSQEPRTEEQLPQESHGTRNAALAGGAGAIAAAAGGAAYQNNKHEEDLARARAQEAEKARLQDADRHAHEEEAKHARERAKEEERRAKEYAKEEEKAKKKAEHDEKEAKSKAEHEEKELKKKAEKEKQHAEEKARKQAEKDKQHEEEKLRKEEEKRLKSLEKESEKEEEKPHKQSIFDKIFHRHKEDEEEKQQPQGATDNTQRNAVLGTAAGAGAVGGAAYAQDQQSLAKKAGEPELGTDPGKENRIRQVHPEDQVRAKKPEEHEGSHPDKERYKHAAHVPGHEGHPHEGRNKLAKDPPGLHTGAKTRFDRDDALAQEKEGIVIEPTTGLPMNVGKYGDGHGGTDATETIEGYRPT